MSTNEAAATVSGFELNNRSSTARRSREVATTRTSRGRRETSGRYDGRDHGASSGRPPSLENVRTAVASVDSPYGLGLETVVVNRRVDILENERARGRISEAAYRTGRQIQLTFERLSTLSGSSLAAGGGGTGNPKEASDMMAVRGIEAAQDIRGVLSRMQARIGMIDTRLLRQIVGDRLTFAQCAALRGMGGTDRGAHYIAQRFREALEDLAQAWTAKGAVQACVADKHHEASQRAVDRQRASIEAGVTTERRESERKAEEARRARLADPARRAKR